MRWHQCIPPTHTHTHSATDQEETCYWGDTEKPTFQFGTDNDLQLDVNSTVPPGFVCIDDEYEYSYLWCLVAKIVGVVRETESTQVVSRFLVIVSDGTRQ